MLTAARTRGECLRVQGGRTLWAAGQRLEALRVGAAGLPLSPDESLASGLAQEAALPEPVGVLRRHTASCLIIAASFQLQQ